MTRLRKGAQVAVPQDAPGRGSKPAPPTPGETVLKPNRIDRVPTVVRSPAVSGGRGCHTPNNNPYTPIINSHCTKIRRTPLAIGLP
ncbi:MAG: hypothetical protein ABEJ58_06630, partial [Halodesulfurarchaeum sp.]